LTVYIETQGINKDEQIKIPITTIYDGKELSYNLILNLHAPVVEDVGSFMDYKLFSFTVRGFSSIDDGRAVSKEIVVRLSVLVYVILFFVVGVLINTLYKRKSVTKTQGE
jgi:hypothetical protein